jgi:hypothetical protein
LRTLVGVQKLSPPTSTHPPPPSCHPPPLIQAWSTGLTLADYQQQAAANVKTVEEMKALATRWVGGVREGWVMGLSRGERDCRAVRIRGHARPTNQPTNQPTNHPSLNPTHPNRYNEAVAEEGELTPEQRVVANVGKMDARKHLAAAVTDAMGRNIDSTMGTLLDTIVF